MTEKLSFFHCKQIGKELAFSVLGFVLIVYLNRFNVKLKKGGYRYGSISKKQQEPSLSYSIIL